MSETKLATIVAVDIAGYSARAQSDEAAAIASVARLNVRCADVSKAHEGRIFSTAGDAVMMEFPSVSDALAAAEELAHNPDPPIRIGIHLGEVTVMPNGDLLGHGVNVAARLQSMAPTGGVLVSADARRALRGPMAARLVEKGVVKLDKIGESIGVYGLAEISETEPHAPVSTSGTQATRAPRDWRVYTVAALAAVTGVVLISVWVLRNDPSTSPARVAVFALEAPQDNERAQRLATGVAEDISLALSAINVQTVASDPLSGDARDERLERARTLGALLVLDGAVQVGNAQDVRLTLAVARSSDNVTLWTRAFALEGAPIEALRQRASERAADVLSCGVNALRMYETPLDTETLSLFLRSCEEWRGAPLEAHDTLAQVIEREPRFSFARARMALSAAVGSGQAPESIRDDVMDEARSNARRALRENPNLGEAYVALQLIEAPHNWTERDRLMRQAIERDPRNATVANFYATLLNALGRNSEGLAFSERSMALDPLSPPKRRSLALLLLDSGRPEEARDLLEPMGSYMPDSAPLWRARLRVALRGGRFDEAADLLDNPLGEARAPAVSACWRRAVRALDARDMSAQSIAGIRACSGTLPLDQAILIHAALGDLDHAFTLANRMTEDAHLSAALFSPPAAPMRADPRFMLLMRDWGLLQFWQDTGRWPDFCADPELPYRCPAEARRLL